MASSFVASDTSCVKYIRISTVRTFRISKKLKNDFLPDSKVCRRIIVHLAFCILQVKSIFLVRELAHEYYHHAANKYFSITKRLILRTMLYIIHKEPWESKPPKDSSSLAFQTFYWTKAFCYILRAKLAKFPRKEYRHFVIHRINLWSPSWCTVCMMTEYLIKWIYNTGNYNTRMITVKSCVYARCTSPKINNNFDLWRLGVNTEDKIMTKTRKPSFRRSNIRVTHNWICQNRIFFFKLDFDLTLGLKRSHPIALVWEKY